MDLATPQPSRPKLRCNPLEPCGGPPSAWHLAVEPWRPPTWTERSCLGRSRRRRRRRSGRGTGPVVCSSRGRSGISGGRNSGNPPRRRCGLRRPQRFPCRQEQDVMFSIPPPVERSHGQLAVPRCGLCRHAQRESHLGESKASSPSPHAGEPPGSLQHAPRGFKTVAGNRALSC